MRTIITIIMIILSSGYLSAQIEEISQQAYMIRQAIEAVPAATYIEQVHEDGSSSFTYLFHYNKNKLLKVEELWNGGCCSPSSLSIYYFEKSHTLYEHHIHEHRCEKIDEARNHSNENSRDEILIYTKEEEMLISSRKLTEEETRLRKKHFVGEIQYLQELFKNKKQD